jgi:hypothetical protein
MMTLFARREDNANNLFFNSWDTTHFRAPFSFLKITITFFEILFLRFMFNFNLTSSRRSNTSN